MVRNFGESGDWESYNTKSPFPHIVIEDFLNTDTLHNVSKEAYVVCTNPHEDWRFGGRLNSKDEHDFQRKKRGISAINNLPYHTKELVNYLNGDEFISKLESLTGKRGLIADPSLVGGGLHETRRGGYLGIHHDFNTMLIDNQKYYRQINLLLYINPYWDESWGGHLEFWNKEMLGPSKIVNVKSNRCVIFNIDGAPHGHPHPLNSPSGISRRSIAMYYYSKEVPKTSETVRARWEPELKTII
jgi:Rps23 Pro-64 3,4-dihydroxylase Tpa1-like proline 4-hydroxylase